MNIEELPEDSLFLCMKNSDNTISPVAISKDQAAFLSVYLSSISEKESLVKMSNIKYKNK